MIYNPQCSMPILNWIGKEAVVNHDKDVSFRLLKKNKSKSVGDSENLIIEGDNLEALKALLPHYQNKIKCIYIDPPYNTGNENWVYNDNVNSPKIKKWLGKVVGKIGEDLSRHDKWLCMMYPRLKLLRELLNESGVIFISIDEIEEHHLRNICDEVFGPENFIEKIVWNKRIPKNDKGIGNIHEYVLVWVKDSSFKHKFEMSKNGIKDVNVLLEKFKKSKTPIQEAETELRKLYNKKDYDRGITLYNSLDINYRLWGKINMSWPNSNTFGPRYEVLHPITNKPVNIPDRGWRWKKDTFDKAINLEQITKLHDGTYICGRIWFDKDEHTQPSSILFLDDVESLLLRSIISLKSDGGIEVEELFDGKSYFSYPKPISLIKILIDSLTLNNIDIIIDFISVSGVMPRISAQVNS